MISIGIVTWNSAKYIESCITSIINQSYKNFEILVIDNFSSDNTISIVENYSNFIKIIKNNKNYGFCQGHNIGINNSNGESYLPLNPDIILDPNYLKSMQAILEAHPETGSVSGKLLRLNPYDFSKTNTIDSTGIYFKKNRRCLDRGSDQIDTNQYNNIEYIFGASGAAPLYRRSMLNDIKINNEYFFDLFFAYREDVDLAWRAQLRKWKCIYTPYSIAYHVRTNTPQKRQEMSDFTNMNSVKNKIIMLIQNETLYGLIRDGIIFITYELVIFSYVLFKERSTLKGYKIIFNNIQILMKNRKIIQKRNISNDFELKKWFGSIQSISIKDI